MLSLTHRVRCAELRADTPSVVCAIAVAMGGAEAIETEAAVEVDKMTPMTMDG